MRKFLTAIFAISLFSTPALAQDYYGAIAYSQDTDAHGWSYDYPTRAEAEARAMSECAQYGRGCEVTTWFRNACGALAVGSNRGWGASWGEDQYAAQAEAMSICRRHDKGCDVVRWACTTR